MLIQCMYFSVYAWDIVEYKIEIIKKIKGITDFKK